MPPPPSASPTSTSWTHEFDTIRRENLFRNPPKDHTAYPALKAAIAPHVESFNALFGEDGLIAQSLLDIGTKTYLDGNDRDGPAGKNKLTIKIKEVFVEKSVLPPSNKFSTRNREILPAECRERHVTYRGKMRARFEFQINNGDPKEFVRELGQIPLMLMVSGIRQVPGQMLTVPVKSMPSREQLPCPIGATERRGRRTGWILRGQWHRKAHPTFGRQSKKLPNGNRTAVIRRQGTRIHEVWNDRAISTSRSNIPDQCSTLPQGRQYYISVFVAEGRIPHSCYDDFEGAGGNQ
jgi:DNA-directed RNA polymerase beta subunit